MSFSLCNFHRCNYLIKFEQEMLVPLSYAFLFREFFLVVSLDISRCIRLNVYGLKQYTHTQTNQLVCVCVNQCVDTWSKIYLLCIFPFSIRFQLLFVCVFELKTTYFVYHLNEVRFRYLRRHLITVSTWI